MIFKRILINNFGGLREKDIELISGVNVLYGMNETEKNIVFLFVKNMFFGMPEKMQEKNGYSGRNHGGTKRKSKNPNGNNKNPGKTNGNYKNSNAGHKNTKPASTGNGRGESSLRPQKKKSIRNVHKRK